jgi:type II secretory pathway pseudopilin PulG
MALKLPRLARALAIVTTGFLPTEAFRIWWQQIADAIENAINSLTETVEAVAEAQAAAAAAQTAADAAQDAADSASTAAATAQATADAVEATVSGLVIPPTGTLNVSASAALTADDVTVLANATGGAITLTLPAASSSITPISITKVDGSANAVNVVPGGGDQLNGGAGPVSLTLSLENKSFVSDQISEWYG